MFGLFGKSKALKQYFKTLPVQLRKDYGQVENLNAQQIRRSVQRGKLNERYVMYAYMIFMTRKDFADEFGGTETYDMLAKDLGVNTPTDGGSYYVGNGYDAVTSTSFDAHSATGGSDGGGV